MLYCDTIINKSKKKKQKTYSLNYIRDPKDKRDFKYTSLFKKINKVANKLSSSIEHSILMSSVKDQGTLGSCVGFAVTAMKEWQEAQEHKNEVTEGKRDHRKGKEYDLSESWLYWNSKKIDPWPGQEGTSIRYAMKVLNKIGVPTESAWPYKSINVGKPKKWAKMISVWALIDKYWRIDTLTELRVALAKNPVPIGIPCFSEIFSVGADGIVPYPSNPDDSKGGHAVCLSGDTKVPLLNGETYSMLQLSLLYPDKKFWVYSCDKKGNIVPGLAYNPRKTGYKKVLKITLDNDESFKCTEDHEILCRDGKYKKAKDLINTDSIMPLYRKKGYYDYGMIFNPGTKEWLYTHKVMCSNRINDNGKKVVHHKNFDKYNNEPTNLQEMLWDDHAALHAKYADPTKIIEYAKSDIGREKSKQLMIDNWNNKEFRKKMENINKENGKKVSKQLSKENRCGFQAMSKEKLKEIGHKNGKKNHIYLNTNESHKKSGKTLHKKFEEDMDFKEECISRARKNISSYNTKISNGKIKPTKKQLDARKINGQNMTKRLTNEQKQLKALKTAYTRWYKDKFKSFKDYLEFKEVAFNNHKIKSIEEYGYEDVYDLTVDKFHNFAIDSGTFVHNCAVGYNNDLELIKFKNSWGSNWGDNGYGYLSYDYIRDFLWDAWTCTDISVTKEMLKETRSLYG